MIQRTKESWSWLINSSLHKWKFLTWTCESSNGIPQKDHNPTRRNDPVSGMWMTVGIMMSCEAAGMVLTSALH